MTTPVYDSVAYLASDKFAVFNAAGDSFASEFAPGLRLRADCGTDGVLLGTVAAASFDAATSRTVVTTAMDGGAALTANLAAVLHGNDLPASLCAHAALHAIGGRDPLPGATTGVSGLVSLATTAETQAGTSAAKAVTPAGLAASAKGLMASHTTIYVATTGNDATGTGSSSAPYASIARALSSIAGKLIATGVTVTIQVADGTYAVGSTIVIDHPDADKIQILGNTSTETTVAITSIDTTAKTITVAGDYTGSIAVGDIIGLTGSSTSGLNGAYVVSGRTYSGGSTVITCSAETFASATVGGGSIVIKPCNKCRLILQGDIHGFYILTQIKLINGFYIESEAAWSGASGFYGYACRLANIGRNNIITGAPIGVYAFLGSVIHVAGLIMKNVKYGANPSNGSFIEFSSWEGTAIIDHAEWAGIVAYTGSTVYAYAPTLIMRNCPTPYSPPVNTSGNGNSFIQQ